MPPIDAITLENWFPGENSVRMRKGFTSHATGMTNLVETLATFHSGATEKLLAFAGGAIFDASSSGAASSLGTGYSNARWQWVMFNESLHAVNGEDAPIAYDGSSITEPSWAGSGLTVADLIGVNVFKNRLFFWEDNSQDFWYASVNAVTGTLTKFPLSMVAALGGKLIAMATWTLDGGAGIDDLAVFIMSSGQVVTYQGTDPGSSSGWALQGIYDIGPPLSSRAVTKVAGDVVVATKEDYVLLSDVIKRGRVKGRESKIAAAASEAASLYSGNYGWQVFHYPKGGWVLVNVPVTTGSRFEQHILNTVTGAWCKFTGMNGVCWGLYQDNLYFGGASGVVYRADNGNNDNSSDIPARAQQAWNSFGIPGTKMLTAFRPVYAADGEISLGTAIAYDFGEKSVATVASPAPSGAMWDEAEWDEAFWAGALTTRAAWKSATGTGHVASLKVNVTTKDQNVSWYRTDFMIRPGYGLV